MDRIDAMKIFVTALDEGSLAGAGRRLGRSPAAVSRAALAGTVCAARRECPGLILRGLHESPKRAAPSVDAEVGPFRSGISDRCSGRHRRGESRP